MTANYLLNHTIYIPIYLICSLPRPAICTFGLLADSVLIVTVSLHISGQLATLSQCRLNNLAEDSLRFQQNLIGILVHHNRQIRLAQRINSVFSIFLLHIGVNVLFYICVIGYTFILNLHENELKVLIVYFVDFTAVTVITLTYCYCGQCLIDESLEVGNALYSNVWYTLKPKDMICYVMLIERTQQPLVLTACGFFIYRFELSVNFMKTGLAYLSVLRVINGL